MTDQSSPYAPYQTTATPVLPQAQVAPRTTAFYAWLIILASFSALGLVVIVVLSALVAAIATANSGDINVLFVGLLLAGASFSTAPVAAAALVLGLMLIPRVRVARDRILAVSSIVLGGLGALSPTILYVWSFIASRH